MSEANRWLSECGTAAVDTRGGTAAASARQPMQHDSTQILLLLSSTGGAGCRGGGAAVAENGVWLIDRFGRRVVPKLAITLESAIA